MQQAKLLVLANFGHVEDRVKVAAALQGAVVLSAAVLLGREVSSSPTTEVSALKPQCS